MKIAAASSVLLVGLAVALLFRQEPPRAGPPAPGTSDRLVLRRRVQPQFPPSWSRDGRSNLSDSATPAAGRTATILRAMDAGESPPALPRDYPGAAAPGTSRWGTSIGMNLPAATRPDESLRTHKIVDGDTLHTLAERYLGSADRYMEIYEANREVLPSPEILPIGVELEIHLSSARCRGPSGGLSRAAPGGQVADQ